MKKRHILISACACALFGLGLGLSIDGRNAVPANAESADAAVDDTDETVWYETAMGWVEDKIVPIMGSSAVVSVVSAATAVGTALAKRAGDKRTKKVIELQNASLANMEKAVEAMAKSQESALGKYDESYRSAMECLDKAAKQVEEMGRIAKEQSAKMENVVAMKESIDASSRLIAKALLLSKEAVKSGIASDAQILVAHITRNGGNGDGVPRQ